MDLTQEEYVKDPRIACKYGWKCYQKNPIHQTKYKHPPKKRQVNHNYQQPNKKQKLNPDVATSTFNKIDKNDEDIEEKIDNVERNKELISESDNENIKIKVVEKKIEIPEKTEIEIKKLSENKNLILSGFDKKEFIKSKFLVEMPNDFYQFWDFCKNLNSKDPCLALKEIDLTLVGPFDVLSGKFDDKLEQDNENYLIHWRFYYDPPEFQTILIGTNWGYHIGYFRDEPNKNPVFLAENYAEKNGSFSVMGDNIFGSIFIYLNDLLKKASPFKKMSIQKFINLIKKESERLDLNLSKKTNSITQRDRNVIARSFNSLGMVVPYNKKTELGYRPLAISNKELKVLFEKLAKATDSEKASLMSDLQPVLTYASIATDECDFATGLELGLDMLFYGIEHLNLLTKKYLSTAYNLLNRSEFALIIQAHMSNRRKGSDLSII
ncbi:histone PARylation factor 1 [Onthophagus taurus]|uniref:histone PARylation factor 1 n=1 Tax=Onthophagus taurus TaxID=166361 RepID=UPI0039BE127C